MVKKTEDTFIRFDRIHEDRQTDRQLSVKRNKTKRRVSHDHA